MRALTEDEIRASFINHDHPERIPMPWWLDATLWDTLDYLGWIDPASPTNAYIVAESHPGLAQILSGDKGRPGDLAGVALRLPKSRPLRGRRGLCNLCRTQHRGVDAVMMVAPRAGEAGRNYNTVGTYICADLACSLYIRRLRRATGGGFMPETIDEERRVGRLRTNLDSFIERVAA
ncbi:FBP domain-containing protein [Nigerium massiliense]|uniref:FBP domain-containing protein n=1 Tax=Nigerium massiliense TaxID=1522317 RepID=UPI00059176EF|nr:FBP domain-containing protein [Nigerium massiliense]